MRLRNCCGVASAANVCLPKDVKIKKYGRAKEEKVEEEKNQTTKTGNLHTIVLERDEDEL